MFDFVHNVLFWIPSQDPKRSKKLEKEEKEFRKKFKVHFSYFCGSALRSESCLNALLLPWSLTGNKFNDTWLCVVFCHCQFEGPIQVLCCMMVDPNANIKKGSGKDLTVVKGEILEVIQQTNEKKVLCRNRQGKCTCCAPSCEKLCNTTVILWFCFIYIFDR